MKKQFLFILFLLYSALGLAQKDTRRIIEANTIKTIEIQAEEIAKVSIEAVPKTSNIEIVTHSDGEYFNNIALESRVSPGTLFLNTVFPEKLSSGYDKLSAHKVFSLEVELKIPENMQVEITSNYAALVARGTYQKISANLKQGYCQLLYFNGNAVVNTYLGDIEIHPVVPVRISAHTRHGTLSLPAKQAGAQMLELNSINGDISVLETK